MTCTTHLCNMKQGVWPDGRAGEMMEGQGLVDVLYVNKDLKYVHVVLQGNPFAILNNYACN